MTENKNYDDENKTSNTINYEFQSLTPVEDVEKMEGYNEALDNIFKKPELKNIAITGGYGSGKSSIVKTYEKNSDGKKICICISCTI